MKFLTGSAKKAAKFLGRQLVLPYVSAGRAVGSAAKSIGKAGRAGVRKKAGVGYAVAESEMPEKPIDGRERFDWYMQLHGTTEDALVGLLARYNFSRRIALVVSCVACGGSGFSRHRFGVNRVIQTGV